jgi:hypothetical protein
MPPRERTEGLRTDRRRDKLGERADTVLATVLDLALHVGAAG